MYSRRLASRVKRGRPSSRQACIIVSPTVPLCPMLHRAAVTTSGRLGIASGDLSPLPGKCPSRRTSYSLLTSWQNPSSFLLSSVYHYERLDWFAQSQPSAPPYSCRLKTTETAMIAWADNSHCLWRRGYLHGNTPSDGFGNGNLGWRAFLTMK